ncbi:Ubiquitin domain [Macleaya cordata]|uniref:Ubiquitin domain n=1 Tax=Macleaya cordata TaxID=56857 RepID=A0A200QKZ9_MACCD|nr:Ubiquitin domain [Macleaya cordata]
MMSYSKKVIIFVETREHHKYPIEVLPSETFLRVKQRIEHLTGVQVEKQTLSLNGLELRDDYNIEFYELKNGMSVNLSVDPIHWPGEKYPIFSKMSTPTGTSYKLIGEVDDTITVAELKLMIHAVLDVPNDVERMKLYYRSREMRDVFNLSTYYITNNSFVEVEFSTDDQQDVYDEMEHSSIDSS